MCEEGAAQGVGGDDLSTSLRCDLDFSFLGQVIKPWHRSANKTLFHAQNSGGICQVLSAVRSFIRC